MGEEQSLFDIMAEMRTRQAIETGQAMAEALVTGAEQARWQAKVEEAKKHRLERLAALEHEQWCYWTRQLVSSGRIPDWLVLRWKANWVPYAELSEEMKEHDRVWARRVVALMEER
jgi:hypothetical protein